MNDNVRAELSQSPLDLAEVTSWVENPASGAIASFTGVVRNHDSGRAVERLEYEAHPDAASALQRVAERVAQGAPGLRIAIIHRIGVLHIGDVAVVAAVSSAHRAEAFSATSTLISELKREVPIWKNQFFQDGTSEWVGSLG